MKIGTWFNLLALLGGIWILAAPVIVGYAPKHGNPWSGILLLSDIIGALVIVTAIAGLAGFWSRFLTGLTPPDDPSALDS